MTSTRCATLESFRVDDRDADRLVGLSLKALRLAAHLTELQMAECLGVALAAISKIELNGDVHISSLQRYIEGLGGRLRIDAIFPPDADFMESVHQILGGRIDDARYILPIFGDEFTSRRDVILSIKPAYSEKILEGIKTVELRRRFPLSAGRGATAYIYSTSPVRALVGAAEITDVERLPIAKLWRRHGKSASILKRDFDAYFSGLREGYAVKISKARPLVRPLDLTELKERFGFKAPQSFLYAKPNLQRALRNGHSNLSD